MIPKRLFFIWFGDNQPDYVKFCINSYRNNNPNFDIQFLRYTVKNIEYKEKVSKYDDNVYKCLDYILKYKHNTLDVNNYHYHPIKNYLNYNRKVLQILANIVRMDLIMSYGGIYVDCDTYSVNPFDDELLKSDFCTNSCTSYDTVNRHPDSHFIGCDGNKLYKRFYDIHRLIDTNYINFENNLEWNNRRKLFYNCILKKTDYIDNYPYYIEHFVDRTWKTGRTPECIYDRC